MIRIIREISELNITEVKYEKILQVFRSPIDVIFDAQNGKSFGFNFGNIFIYFSKT